MHARTHARTGLGFEAVVAPVALLWSTTHTARVVTVAALVFFHVSTGTLVGMCFILNIPVYSAALLGGATSSREHPNTDEEGLDVGLAAVTLAVLGAITLLGIEDWPFSNNGLFPYSGEEAPSLIVVCYLTKTKSTYQPPTHQPTNPPLIIKQTCRQVHK